MVNISNVQIQILGRKKNKFDFDGSNISLKKVGSGQQMAEKRNDTKRKSWVKVLQQAGLNDSKSV